MNCFFTFIKDHFLVHAVPHCPLLLILYGRSIHFDFFFHFAKDNWIIIFFHMNASLLLFKPLKYKWRAGLLQRILEQF